MPKTTLASLLLCFLALSRAFTAEPPLTDKTLVAWVTPANLTQRGGSVLSIDDRHGHWDGIVFGELTPARWMAGSDFHHRTEKNQSAWPAEAADAKTLVQIAVVYHGQTVTTFRNGAEYSHHEIKEPQSFDSDSVVIVGPRHLGNHNSFAGDLADVRIYGSALTGDQLAALQPKRADATTPWAWWTFEDDAAKERTGRFPHTHLSSGAKVANGKLTLDGVSGSLFAARESDLLKEAASGHANPSSLHDTPRADLILNYHLMHPGGDSGPGDPNAAFYLDGVYHLHYILGHAWQGKRSFSFVHVTSPDLVHWTWHKTSLQPSFTGHGMFSGTGFITKEGRPAVIYHGQGSERNQIAIAKDNTLDEWEKPYPLEIKTADGKEAKMRHWDPDCFLIGDTYYAISGGQNPPLIKSTDLKNWTYAGDFLRNNLPDVAIGEDISCGNFFPLGKKWMMLCISHPLGCRYYLGDWDEKAEQFVPERHGRMNWRREDQIVGTPYRDFFAPESVLTPDGRRVMWAWCASLNPALNSKTIQSLPRELSLGSDGTLRIKPLRELESLRFDPMVLTNLKIEAPKDQWQGGSAAPRIAELPGDSVELRLTVAREEAARKQFGVILFPDAKGGGLPLTLRPDNGTLRLGTAEAPFAVADLPPGEDVVLRIFIDKYFVEIFANARQALIAARLDTPRSTDLNGYTFGATTTIKKLEMWKLKPANQDFIKAETNREWEPLTE